MRTSYWFTVAAMSASLLTPAAMAQQKNERSPSPVRLEISTEVAATTDEGYPSVLRVTVKNVSSIAVDMPMPVMGCLPQDGHVFLQMNWKSTNPNNPVGPVFGQGCGEGDMPRLTEQIRKEGIRLRPGEYVTSSENVSSHYADIKPGMIEYWVEFAPPRPTKQDLVELQEAGFVVPTETIESEHQKFSVH
jgi:hypothetical protein